MTQQSGFALFVSILGLAVLAAAAVLHDRLGDGPAPGPAPAGAGAGPAPLPRPDAPPPAGASWPVFRGDGRLLGRAEGGLPAEPRLLWSFPAGDAVKSSPVIGGGRAFVGSSDRTLYALGLAGGEKAWEYKAAAPFEAPPLLAGDCVVAGSMDGVLHAVAAADGAPRWTFKTGGPVVGSANVLPGPDGTGVRGILAGSHDGTLYCLDPAAGKPLWSFPTENYVNGAPSVAKGKIVFGGCDAQVRMLSAEGRDLAMMDAGSYVPASVAFDGRYAYAGVYEKELLCLDLAAGVVAWRYGDRENGSPFFSSPAVAPDRVLIGSQDRRLHCVNRRDGKGLWTFEARGAVDGSPVVCGDRVVFGSMDGRLHVLWLADGSLAWSTDLGAPVSSSPAVAGGVIVVGAEDGRIWAFGK